MISDDDLLLRDRMPPLLVAAGTSDLLKSVPAEDGKDLIGG
jgi:hypothetical protein